MRASERRRRRRERRRRELRRELMPGPGGGRRPMESLSDKLSDWEVEEAHSAHMHGVDYGTLSMRYGVSSKALRRAFARLEKRMVEPDERLPD